MTTLSAPASPPKTIQELLERLGNVPPDRIRLDPLPGTATEDDVIRVEARENRLCELVEGTLVEKAMGFRESVLAALLVRILGEFVDAHQLGVVAGPDGTLRLLAGLVRIPDVAYLSWDRIPGRKLPKDPIPSLVPDLAVEVLSPSNTKAEMARKRQEYFRAGVRLVWLIDPLTKTVAVFSPDLGESLLGENDTLDGRDVLPGFSINLREFFAKIPVEQ